MKKYLGSKFTAYAGVVMPFFIILPFVFTAIVLCSEISAATIFLALLFLSCTVIWSVYLRGTITQLYSWGVFGKEAVEVRNILSKSVLIEYKKCRSVGIGSYTHGVLNSKIGSRVYFIFLSYDAFEEKYRTSINLWKPTSTRIKVQFDKKLYNYLLSVLPSKQANTLQRDYEKYLV